MKHVHEAKLRRLANATDGDAANLAPVAVELLAAAAGIWLVIQSNFIIQAIVYGVKVGILLTRVLLFVLPLKFDRQS